MSKRNKIIKVSTESAALKELRENEGLSLRKLAELMDLSFMRVHQTWEDWNKKTASINPHDALRIKCHEALDSIEPSKLQLIYGLLTSI